MAGVSSLPLDLVLAKPKPLCHPSLVSKVSPQIHKYFSNLGKQGGAVKSAAKSEAVKLNGKLGGRPRKTVSQSADTVITKSGKQAA